MRRQVFAPNRFALPVIRALFCLGSLLATFQPTHAAVMEAWVHRYSNVLSNSMDQGLYMARDSSGDIIVTGMTDNNTSGADILIIKYSGQDGSILWQNRHNGLENGGDYPNALAVDRGNNIVITGSSAGTNTDCYTAKYAAADGRLIWKQRYNGPANKYDSGVAVGVDAASNVFMTGYSHNGTNYDYYTAKYAAGDGTLLWEKRYNGSGNGDDFAQALAVDTTGNVIVTGRSWYDENGYDYYTAKYAAANGALRWAKRYDGPAHSYDFARAVAVDNSDNIIVTGSSHNANGLYDYYTVKYAASGEVRWAKRYTDQSYSYDPEALEIDAKGNVVVTGNRSSSGLESEDYLTVKYAAVGGAVLWEKSYNGPANGDDQARAVAVDGAGNVVVTGYSIGVHGDADFHTIQYAATNGALLWEKRLTNGGGEAVVADSTGNIIVSGSSWGTPSRLDFYTAKYGGSDGTLIWDEHYNSTATFPSYALATAVDGSGNVVVTGYSFNGNGGTDFYTAKYSRIDGALVWEHRYIPPTTQGAQAKAVAVDAAANVIVTGYSYNTIGNKDFYTAKYAALDGALLWEKRYNSPRNGFDQAESVIVDPSGDIVVAGSWDSESGSALYTAKYAGADGELLWEKRFDGPGNYLGGRAYAVAVDSRGHVIVTGSSGHVRYTAKYSAMNGALLWEKRDWNTFYSSHNSAVAVDTQDNVVVTGYNSIGGDADYHTVKYTAADGLVLWERRYNGPANSSDYANAVAADKNDNVVVTGLSVGTASGADYYTAKYAAADGSLLWERRYNGPANSSDYGQAVAVDSRGNVVVTGHSIDPVTTNDYYTAKYAEADGALLWEKRYNGPANGNDQVHGSRSLALGPNGMVVVTGQSDGIPGMGISYDYATVVYEEALPSVSIERGSEGVLLKFTARQGVAYNLERASHVDGPWQLLVRQTATAARQITYIDSEILSGTAFYRVSTP